MTSAPDPHGQAALMLCESLAYLLIEQETVSRQQVIDAIEGVIEVKQRARRRQRRLHPPAKNHHAQHVRCVPTQDFAVTESKTGRRTRSSACGILLPYLTFCFPAHAAKSTVAELT